MHIPNDHAIGGILCDSRFFLLPDTMTINGKLHLLHPDLRPDVANFIRDSATARIIDHWPSFEQYVKDIIAKVPEDEHRAVEVARLGRAWLRARLGRLRECVQQGT